MNTSASLSNQERLRSIAKRIRYKPTSFVDVNEVMGRISVCVGMQVVDAHNFHDNFHGMVPLRYHFIVRPDVSDEMFIEKVRDAFIRMEMHEVDEFFQVDGKHYVDPHPELIKLQATPCMQDDLFNGFV